MIDNQNAFITNDAEKMSSNKKHGLKKKGNKFKEQKSSPTPSLPIISNPHSNSNNNKTEKTTSNLNSKINSKMLDAFWKLSEFSSSIRLEGINQLARYFATLDPQLNQESYNYVLVRLIRGLASNRKCSRLGFSCALTELLNSNESLKFEYVLELSKKHLNYKTVTIGDDGMKKKPTNDTLFTKEEIRHMQIGLAFVYLCWIQSNRFKKADDKSTTSNIKTVVNDLNSLRKNKDFKPYIQQLYLQAEILLMKRVENSQIFQSIMLPEIEADLKDLWLKFQTEEKTNLKDDLNLLLGCLNAYPKEIKHFLSENNLKLKVIFNEKNFEFFYELISQSSESLPNLQPICMELMTYLVCTEMELFRKMWLTLIDIKLFSRKESEKKYLGFKLFLFCLNLVDESNLSAVFSESLLLSDRLIENLVISFVNKLSNLNALSKDIVKELIEIVRVKEQKIQTISIGASLAIKAIKNVKNLHDLSDFVSPIVYVLNDNGLVEYYEFLISELTVQQIELLNNEKLDLVLENKEAVDSATNNSSNGTHDETESKFKLTEEQQLQAKTERYMLKQIWIINQILNMSKNSLTFQNEELIKKILSYLSLHSYFNIDNPKVDMGNNGIKNRYSPILVKNERVESHLRETLLQFAGILLTKNEASSNKTLIFIAKYIDELLQQTKSEKPDTLKLDKKLESNQKQLKATCLKIISLFSKISKSTSQIQSEPNEEIASCNKDVIQTFLLTVSIEFFRMFDSFNNSQQVVEDIEICFEKFLNDQSSGKLNGKKNGKHLKNGHDNEDEPEWIEVLVEMLLNLFTINKNWIRNIVKNQFRKLFPKLTFNSVKLIIDLLDPESENDLVIEDESMDDLKSDAEKNETSADSGDEDDDTDEDSEEDEEMIHKNDSNLDKALKKFNFLKNEETDDEDEEEDDESGIESPSSSKISDDQACSSKFTDEKNKKMKLNNGTSIKKVENGVMNDSDDSADLDDDAMMKLDEALAQQFKLRKKDKKHESFLLQYKLRALDFIQELLKTTYRLDLITIQNSKLPTTEDLFDLIVYIINCSTAHFNVLNTLVETSMYCVRLIQHISNSCNDSKEKDKILLKLTNIYMEIIKNDKSKVNPTMYKEYMIRYPGYSAPLLTQMIDCITVPDVKLHKKTTTLIILNQCINNQMFSHMNSLDSEIFIKKIFQLFELMIKDLVKDEDIHIKFVDAFLNLVSRVLNLPKNLFKKELNENLAAQMSVFIKDSKVKQAYKSRFSNLVQICLRTLK